MIVKVCGITNQQDAACAVEAGVAALGFNFYSGSPRVVDSRTARQITDTLPVHILKVGIFVHEQPDTVARTMREAGLDIAQVIGTNPGSLRTWKVQRVTSDFEAEYLDDPTAEAFLLDAPSDALYGGTGETFDWSRARIPGKRIVIAGGLGPDNVAHAIRACDPWGVDACSRLEASPGRKDPGKVKAFVTAALNL